MDLTSLTLNPADRTIYKLRQSAPFTGQALKLNLRLDPEFKQLGDRTVVNGAKGGFFAEICPQKPGLNENGNPTVDHESPARVTAKFSMPDVTGLLAGYEAYRDRNLAVPLYLRMGKTLEQRQARPDNQIDIYHKTGDGSSTAISWTFREEDSTIRLSKSKERFQQITLTLGEELLFVEYLRNALRAFLLVGF